MTFVEQFIHPERLKTIMIKRHLLIWFGLLVAAGNFLVILSLVAEPSQSGGLLGFSARRWSLVLANLLLFVYVLHLVCKIFTNRAVKLEYWLAKERNRFRLLFLCVIIFSFSFPFAVGAIPVVRYYVYFGRIQPSLFWLSFFSGVVVSILLVLLRHSILSWIQQFLPFNISVPVMEDLPPTQWYFMGGIAFIYIAFQWGSHLQVREARWLPDSIDYIFPASFPWNSPILWTHTKPWGAAVLYKLTGNSTVVIDAVQVTISTMAWLALAWVFSGIFRDYKLRVSVFAFILGFSLAPAVQMWNHIIQSESLSISLMIFILSIWFSLLNRWRWEKFCALIFLFIWWIGTRETNVYLSLLIAIALLLIGLLLRNQRYYWVLSVILVGCSVINMQISEIPTLPRWLYPLTNTVLYRILPNEDFRNYFAENEMPVSTRLLTLSGGYANSDDFAVFNDPDLNEVEKWLFKHGKEVYVRFLLNHPIYTLASPWQHIPELLGTERLVGYESASYNPLMGLFFGSLVYPNSIWLVGLLVLGSIFFTLWKKSWRKHGPFWLVFGFLVLFIPHFYLAWHGDAAEVTRHAIQASIQLRLCLWLLFFLAIDKQRNIYNDNENARQCGPYA